MDNDESVRFAKKYLEDILSFFGLNTDVSATFDGEIIALGIPSTYLNGFLIGQRGETLRSLQYLVSTTLRNRGAMITRVNIDVADYKQQRADRLTRQAEDWIKKVRATGETYSLPPMNAADRRVVHHVVGEYGDLTTRSVGEGKDRHVIIEKVEE
ncbi:single-stranded nucleic acid binding R3H domain protein [candidate division TM7 genomosp. GTL1]|nr:single-stranded nucleic acid binding R3H domain protein [candidate division TM7 genomosp. GTL1]